MSQIIDLYDHTFKSVTDFNPKHGIGGWHLGNMSLGNIGMGTWDELRFEQKAGEHIYYFNDKIGGKDKMYVFKTDAQNKVVCGAEVQFHSSSNIKPGIAQLNGEDVPFIEYKGSEKSKIEDFLQKKIASQNVPDLKIAVLNTKHLDAVAALKQVSGDGQHLSEAHQVDGQSVSGTAKTASRTV